jgi:hypothetical protein
VTDRRRAAGPLHALHERMQAQLPIVDRTAELADVATFLGNLQLPVHRWFRYKESFGATILDALGIDMTLLQDDNAAFVDPFCGVGTTIVAGDLQHRWRALRVGIEVNPFIAFAAAAKARWRTFDPARLPKLIDQVLTRPLRDDIAPDAWPALSTFRNQRLFSAERVSQLVDAVDRVAPLDGPERDLLLLGIAATAEEVGLYRKDGRALRILDSKQLIAERHSLSVERALRRTWTRYLTDLRSLSRRVAHTPGPHHVLQGDGRDLAIDTRDVLGDRQVVLVAFSPPYLNHIDYTEVYKVELWLLGYVAKQDEMLELRRRTLRSHASVLFAEPDEDLPETVTEAIELACDAVEQSRSRWHARLRPVAVGYASDLQRSLRRQHALLAPEGRIVCVVGNSSHGRGEHVATIAADLWICQIAAGLGFEVEKLVMVRRLRRRGDEVSFFAKAPSCCARGRDSSQAAAWMRGEWGSVPLGLA